MVTMRPNAPLLLMAATIGTLWLLTLALVAAGLDAEGGGWLATGVALFVFGGLLRPLLGPLENRSPIASNQRRPLVITATVIAVVFLFATALAPALVPVLWVGVLAPVGFGVATWSEADDRARHAAGGG
jgi:MFS family permease